MFAGLPNITHIGELLEVVQRFHERTPTSCGNQMRMSRLGNDDALVVNGER